MTICEAIIKVEDLLQRDKSFEKVLRRIREDLAKGEEKEISCFRCLTPNFFLRDQKIVLLEQQDPVILDFGTEKSKKDYSPVRQCNNPSN